MDRQDSATVSRGIDPTESQFLDLGGAHCRHGPLFVKVCVETSEMGTVVRNGTGVAGYTGCWQEPGGLARRRHIVPV
jgi:hypothetical protein